MDQVLNFATARGRKVQDAWRHRLGCPAWLATGLAWGVLTVAGAGVTLLLAGHAVMHCVSAELAPPG